MPFDIICHYFLMEETLKIFNEINELLYTQSIEKPNIGKLNTEEEVKFIQRLEVFDENYKILLGYWGIFSIPFSNRPGYVLQSHFFKNKELYQKYYTKQGYFLKPTLVPFPKPTEDVVDLLMNNEVKTREKELNNILSKRKKWKGWFQNPSKTCYIAVILQILFHYRPFFNYLINIRNPTQLTLILRELMINIYLSENSVCLMKLLDYMLIDPRIPDDCFVFLNKLIDILEEEIPNSHLAIFFKVSNNEVFPPLVESKDITIEKLTQKFKLFHTFPKMLFLNIVSDRNEKIDLNKVPLFLGLAHYELYALIKCFEIEQSRHFIAAIQTKEKTIICNDETIQSTDLSIYNNNIDQPAKIVGIVLIKMEGFSKDLGKFTIKNKKDIFASIEEFSLDLSIDLDRITNRNVPQFPKRKHIRKGHVNLVSWIPTSFAKLTPKIPHDEWRSNRKSYHMIDIFCYLLDLDELNDGSLAILKEINIFESLSTFKHLVELLLIVIDIRPLKTNIYYSLLIKILEMAENTNTKLINLTYIIKELLSELTHERIYFLFKIFNDEIIEQQSLIKMLSVITIDDSNSSSLKIFFPEIYDARLKFNNWEMINDTDETPDVFASKIRNSRDTIDNNDLIRIIKNDKYEELNKYIEDNNINPLDQLKVADCNIISVFDQDPSLLQLSIFFNAESCAKLLIEKFPGIISILDRKNYGYIEYIIMSCNNNFFKYFKLNINEFTDSIFASRFFNIEILKLIYNSSSDAFNDIFSQIPKFIDDFEYHNRNLPNKMVNTLNCDHNFELLNNKLFESKQIALDLIRRYAFLSGFKLSKEQGINSNYIVFHCWKGLRKKNKNSLSKSCNCNFRVNLSVHKDGKTKIIVKNPEHNGHELHPEIFSHHFLNNQTKKLIQIMYNANIQIDDIVRFINKSEGIVVIAEQIREIIRKPTVVENETIELVDYVLTNNGKCFSYKDEKMNTQAVLTITQEELKNMDYGQVVFTDATSFPNRKGWKCHPITTLDGNLETIPIGVLFTGCFNKNIAKWFLTKLFSETPLKNVIRTIITDEDSAIMSIIDDVGFDLEKILNRLIAHAICAYHKKKNFKSAIGVLGEERQILIELWDKYVNSENLEESRQAYDALFSRASQSLKKYLQNYVEPIESRFVRSFIKNIFTLGHNTSNVAENYNFQSKRFLYLRYYTLLQMRNEITRIFYKSVLKKTYREEHKFQKQDLILNVLHLNIHPKPRELLIKSINKSFRLQCKDDKESVEIIDPLNQNKEIISIIGLKYLCSCSKVNNMGLPCSHLITFYEMRNLGFPSNLIHNRFIISSFPLIQVPNLRKNFEGLSKMIEEDSKTCEPILPKTNIDQRKVRSLLIKEATSTIDIVKASQDGVDYFLNAINEIKEKFLHSNGFEIDPSGGKGERKLRRIKASGETNPK